MREVVNSDPRQSDVGQDSAAACIESAFDRASSRASPASALGAASAQDVSSAPVQRCDTAGLEGRSDDDAPRPPRADIGERLQRDLGAHRTAALQAALVQCPQVALAALAHRVAETVFGRYGPGNDIVRVTTRVCGDGTLAQAASGYADSRAAAVLSQAESDWGDRMPGRPEALFAWLLSQPQDTVLDLLGYCTARSIDAIGARSLPQPDMSDALALGVDMADWWRPTPQHDLQHVSKRAMLDPPHWPRSSQVRVS